MSRNCVVKQPWTPSYFKISRESEGGRGLTWGQMCAGSEWRWTGAISGVATLGRCMADVADSLEPSQGAPRETRLSPERLPCSCPDGRGGCNRAARARPGAPTCRPCMCTCQHASNPVQSSYSVQCLNTDIAKPGCWGLERSCDTTAHDPTMATVL